MFRQFERKKTMNNNYNYPAAEEKGAAYAAFVNAPPPPTDPYTEFKKKAAQSYNRTGGALLIHYGIVNIVQIIVVIAASVIFSIRGYSQQEVVKEIQGLFVLLTAASLSYLIANPAGTVIGLAFTGRLKEFGGMFGKPRLSVGIFTAGIFAITAIQNICGYIQQIISTLIDSSGTEGTIIGQIEFTDDHTLNIMIVLYVVVFGPVLEELLFRGMVLKNLCCTDVRFGIIMSSVFFGLFHGNIMQFVIAFVIGVFMSYMDIQAGSIIPSIVYHVINNGMAAIIMYLQYAAPDSVETFGTVYLIISLVFGIAGMVYIYRKLGKPSPDADNPYTPICNVPAGYTENHTWKLAFKTPCIIIYTVITVIMLIYSMFPSAEALPEENSISPESSVTTEITEEQAAAALAWAFDK